MRVVWTERAKGRLRHICAYVAKDQPENADRLADLLTCRVMQLAEQPRTGRVVEKYEREDLSELIKPPYRIAYLVLIDRIDIITVRDTRRVLPRRLDDL